MIRSVGFTTDTVQRTARQRTLSGCHHPLLVLREAKQRTSRTSAVNHYSREPTCTLVAFIERPDY